MGRELDKTNMNISTFFARGCMQVMGQWQVLKLPGNIFGSFELLIGRKIRLLQYRAAKTLILILVVFVKRESVHNRKII